MTVLSVLLWLSRQARRRPAARRLPADSRERRRVRPVLELLEGRLAPGNLLFADGMAMTTLLSQPDSGVTAGPGDPLPNPFTTGSASSSSGKGLGLSFSPPTTGGAHTNSTSGGGASPAVSTGGGSSSSSGGGSSAPLSNPGNSSSGNMLTLGGGNPAAPTGGSSSGGGAGSLGGGGSGGSSGSSGGSGTGQGVPPLTYGYVQFTGLENSQGQPLNGWQTKDQKPILVGIGAPNETLTFTIDGAPAGATTVAANGQWSWQVPTALPQGAHVIQATSSGAGIIPESASQTINVDLTPPTVTLTVPPLADYIPPVLTVTATPNNPSGLNSTVHIDVDLQHDGSFADAGDTDYGIATLQSNGTASFYLMNPLPAGTYSLRARVYDGVGNEGDSAISTMIVNPNMGFIGSQPLLDLAYGVSYGTAIPIPGDPPTPPPNYPPGFTMPYNPGQKVYWPGTAPGGPAGGPGDVGPAGFSFLQFDNQGRVLVDVHSTLGTYLNGLTNALTAQSGFTSIGTYPSQVMVQGWLPINQILTLPLIPNFGSVDPVYKPMTKGLSDQNADALIKGPQFRASQGVNGTGEKIGIISDSVNEFQGGLSESVAAGALPNNVQVIADDPSGSGTDEGRAMLEIAHAIAPGAALAFNTASPSPQAFASGIGALAAAGSTVIADDVGYADEPFFNDGVIAQAAESVVNQGIFYDSAAGNAANQGYLANWHPVSTTVGGITGTFQAIQGGSPLQTFTLPAGGEIVLSFDWDSAFL
ncbi:MAG TPA: Ig-like domain-containing protein, partial [Gemmataceae bacterium]|nr:Ig-like domain-containing protein [Gemmataceae bacterium]